MENKVVIVTGGSRGIGRETIIEFAKNKYAVVINYYSDIASANELRETISSLYKVPCLVIQADISLESDVKRLVGEVLDNFGRIDVLVNNAGIAVDCLMEDKTVENFRRTLDVNLIGAFLMSREVSKTFISQKSGKIINIASTNGIDTYYPMSIDYDASKAGLISLTHNLANQYAPYIQVNAIAAGWVKTDALKDMDLEFSNQEKDKILLKRFAEPDEIAKVVFFLASDSASYINDTIVRVDGGVQK